MSIIYIFLPFPGTPWMPVDLQTKEKRRVTKVYLYIKYSFLRLLYKYCVNVEDQHSPETETVNIQFSLRFLDIILRVLRLEISVWISQNIGKRV
jgi:hypothetical protein